MPHPRPWLAALALMALVSGLHPAAADGDDHSRARAAVRDGRALPLERIVAQAKEQFGGEVLDVELEEERNGLRYELKLMAADGRILKVEYDAATGALVHVKGRRHHPDGPR